MTYRYNIINLKDLHGESSTWRDEQCALRAASDFTKSVKTEMGHDAKTEVYKGDNGWHWRVV